MQYLTRIRFPFGLRKIRITLGDKSHFYGICFLRRGETDDTSIAQQRKRAMSQPVPAGATKVAKEFNYFSGQGYGSIKGL